MGRSQRGLPVAEKDCRNRLLWVDLWVRVLRPDNAPLVPFEPQQSFRNVPWYANRIGRCVLRITILEKLPPVRKPLDTDVSLKPLADAGRTRHDMFSIFALVAFTVVFAGFARTFFLRFLFTSARMPIYLYVHGVLFSGWFALFFIQSRLIAFHRVDLHRRLGMLGAGLAGLGVPVAIGVAIHAGRRLYEAHSKPFSTVAQPFALDFGACLAFTVFIGLALYFRRHGEAHKRLMLLGSSSILLPAIGRIPGFFGIGGLWGLVGFAEIVPLTFIVFDTVRCRRLHPAFAWGGLGIVLSWPAFLLVGSTGYWLRFIEWLVRR